MTHYRINEVFYSLQGEGIRAGTANVFVRFTGCNLRCALEPGPRSPGGFDCDTEFESAPAIAGIAAPPERPVVAVFARTADTRERGEQLKRPSAHLVDQGRAEAAFALQPALHAGQARRVGAKLLPERGELPGCERSPQHHIDRCVFGRVP